MNLGRNRLVHRLTALLILVAVFTAHSFAFSSHALAATGVPNIISYQGRLRDASGTLLGSASGTNYYFKFSIYDNATVGSGTKLWPSSAPSLTTSTVTSGIFTVKIGDTTNGYPDALDYNFQDNKDVYLQIEVSSDGTTFETLSPRQRIASAGFAINAGTVQGFTPSQTPSGSAIPVLNSGNLLLSGTNPQINATSTNALVLQGGGGTGDIRFFSASNTLSSLGNLLLAGGLTATTGSSSLATTTIAQLTVSGSSALQSVSLTNASSTNLTASGFINAGTITVSGTSTLAGVVSSFLSNTGATVLGSTLSVTGLATLSTVSATSATTTNFFATNASTTNLTVASNVYLPDGSITAAYLASTAVSAGTYGSASEVATFTVDADGRLTGATTTAIALGASAITSGILGVTRGGTNTSTLGSAGSVAYSDGTGYAFSAAGSANQLLTSGATGAPTFQNIASLLTAGSNISLSGTTNATIAVSATPSFTTLTVSGTSTLANVSSTNITASGFVNGTTLNVSGATALGSTLAVTGVSTLATTTATGLTVSTNGLTISSSTPLSTTNTLYNLGGSLYFNGSAVGGSSVTASGTLGYIQLSNGTGGLTANSLFKWDNTNARLGLGTSATPSSTLHVVGDFTVTATSTFQGPTIINDLQLGAAIFDANAGQLSWIDMPVTSAATAGTVQAYSAQLDGTPLLTVYGQSDGSGGIQNYGVQVGTSTASTGLFTVATSTTIFNVTQAGLVGIGTGATPSSTLHVVGTFQASGAASLGSTFSVTGASTLATTTATNVTISSNGLTLASSTPVSTTNTLYNLGGSLYFNGSAVGGGGGPFTDGTGISYLTDTAEDFAVGGSTVSGSPFGVDVSAGTIYGGLATAAGLTLSSRVTNSGSSVGFTFDTANSLSTSGAKIASFKTAGSEKAAIDKDGVLSINKIASFSGVGNVLAINNAINGNHVLYSREGWGAGLYWTNNSINWTFDGGSGGAANVSLEAGGLLALDATPGQMSSAQGDSGFTKSAASGGNMSFKYDTVEFLRTSQTGMTIATSTLVGTSSNLGQTPSSTLHVVGTFQVTATSTLSGPTIIDDLAVGNANFETDAGQVSWIDMPVTASSSNGTVMSYSAQLDGNLAMVVYGTSDGAGGVANVGVGFGTSTPGAAVHVYASGTTVGMFDRGASDGTVISIRRDNAEQGTISVTTGTVSYNAFTGSHYALLDDPTSTIAFGEVVTLTGNNSRLHGNETDEILYGIERAGVENDPAVLGVYLGPQESSKPASVDNPILVMAVGNGEVWVAADQDETGVMAGDYLITSDLPGYAMRDPRTATTSYVFARAGESINWNEVTATASEGRKKAKISVFFESFARDNAAMAPRAIVRTSSSSGGVIGTLEAFESLTVNGPLTVKGPVALGKDSAGQAKVVTGDQRVEVVFASAYATMPIINVTPVGESALDANFRYAIISQSKERFIIGLANPAYRDLVFNWTAFAAAEDALLTVSNGTTLLLNEEVIAPATSDESPAISLPPEISHHEDEEVVATSTPAETPSLPEDEEATSSLVSVTGQEESSSTGETVQSEPPVAPSTDSATSSPQVEESAESSVSAETSEPVSEDVEADAGVLVPASQ